VVVATGYTFFLATYLPINAFSVGREAATLYLPGEARLPFIPEFEYLYALGYVLPVIAVLKIPTAEDMVQTLWAFVGTLAVAYTTYVVFPVYLERPALNVNSPATFLLSLEYRDYPYNHFPSLHVALVWLGYFACRAGLRRPAVYATLALGMTAGAVFVKQHYVVDLLYGFALAWTAWISAGYWVRRDLSAPPSAGSVVP
jgi:membrane-associated phospholipid phosphatase